MDMNKTDRIHIGQCIKSRLEVQGQTTVWLAQQLGCHRSNLYKLYDKHTIDTGVLLRISRIMDYDFFQLYSEKVGDEHDVPNL